MKFHHDLAQELYGRRVSLSAADGER